MTGWQAFEPKPIDLTHCQAGTFTYDCEVYPNAFFLVLTNTDNGQYHTVHLSLELLRDYILNPLVTLIGWNNSRYDDVLLKYIAHLCKGKDLNNLDTLPVTTQQLYLLSKEIIESSEMTPQVRFLTYLKDPFLFQSIDIKGLMDPMPSLKKVEVRMRFHNVQDLPLDPHEDVPDDQLPMLIDYCHNDVEATEAFRVDHAQTHIELREFLKDKFDLDQDLRSFSEPRTAEFILSNQYITQTTRTGEVPTTAYQIKESLPPINSIDVKDVIPDWIQFKTDQLNELLTHLRTLTLPIRHTGYIDGSQLKHVISLRDKSYQLGIGGLHSMDDALTAVSSKTRGVSLIDADVVSYYPSILLRDDLYPRGYGPLWNEIYGNIFKERLAAKEAGHDTESYALKILLNSAFGKFGSQYSSFYDPALLLRITLTGQLALLMLIEDCTEHGIKVLSANTDGILVRLKDPIEHTVFSILCRNWEEKTQLTLEYNHYDRYARRDVNNYCALTTDGKEKSKGIFLPPDIKHDTQAPIIAAMARAYALHDVHPLSYLEHADNNITIYDFLYSYSATKAYQVKLKNVVSDFTVPLQKSNRWYRSKRVGNKLVKVGGKLNNTISVPNGAGITIANTVTDTKIPDDLNIDHYLAQVGKLLQSCDVTF